MSFIRYLLLWLALSQSAFAFTVEGPRGGGTDPIQHLLNSPRWDTTSGSLLETGERGLGGGLEYVLDDSLCSLRFDDPDTDCTAVKAAVREAFAIWAGGHPVVYFSDISGEIPAAFPLAALGQTAQGAEIDILAARPSEFPPFLNSRTHGYTLFYSRPAVFLSATNAQQIFPSDGRIESADIRVNSASRYTLDSKSECHGCVHFPSLILHEIGHALGIGHPDELTQYNLDTDQTPGNPIVIDCLDPSKGLQFSPVIDPASVAIGQDVDDAGRWKRGLSYDDEAARNALYPNCEITPFNRPERWGVLSLDGDEFPTIATGFADETSARQSLPCAETSDTNLCKSANLFRDCIAAASDGRKSKSYRNAATRPEAERLALFDCNAASGHSCYVQVSACATD